MLASMMSARNINATELDILVDKAEATVQNTWLGSRPRLPDINNLLRICDTLDCTPSDLLGY